MAEQLLTLKEVAKFLNIDQLTVYRLVAKKRLPAFKVGGQWRFTHSMIEAWLKRNSNIQKGRYH